MWFDFMTKLKILIITFVHIFVEIFSDFSLQERMFGTVVIEKNVFY